LNVGGRIQWPAVVRLAKVVAAALAIITPAVIGSWKSYELTKAETQVKVSEIENTAKKADKRADLSYEVFRRYAEPLERRLAALEAVQAQAKAPKGPRKPPKPAPPRPAPLPKDLNAAEAQLKAKPPSVAAPPTPDGGA
jgi:hypothetical protein